MTWQPARVVEILGEEFAESSGNAIRRMVDEQVGESDDLEFKGGLYRLADGDPDTRRKQRLELAKDVASLANHRGGALIMGIRENQGDGTAKEIKAFSMRDSDWRHLTQAASDLISPPVAFERLFIATEPDGSGVVALIVPPSPRRPHGVVDGKLMSFPVRDHRDTRYLSEAELSVWYRQRNEAAGERQARHRAVIQEGLASLSSEPWLWTALTPDQGANWAIDSAHRRSASEWLAAHRMQSWLGPGVEFATTGTILVGRKKFRIANLNDQGQVVHTYAEVHSDGSIFVAKELTSQLTKTGLKLNAHETYITASVFMQLNFVGLVSADLVGAAGEAVVTSGVRFGEPIALSIASETGYELSRFTEGELVASPVTEPVSLPLDELRTVAGAVDAVRFVGGELVQSYGLPEVRAVDGEGNLRLAEVPPTYRPGAERWAEIHGVPTTQEPAATSFY